MQEFYVIVGREALYLYEKKETAYSRQYIQGKPEFRYQVNQVKIDIERLVKLLADEYNLDNYSDMQFMLIENADAVVTEAVCRGFEGYLSKRCPRDAVMPVAMKKLIAEGMPLLEEFGVNFDGVNYRQDNSGVRKSDFSLLGYTLQADDFMRYVG